MEATPAGPTFWDLPTEVLELLLRDLNTRERVRFFCLSASLYHLSRQPDAPFFRSVDIQLSSPACSRQVVRWLAARRGTVHNLVLLEYTREGSRGGVLAQLAGGPLDSLTWGIYQPQGHGLGYLGLPCLRRLCLTATRGPAPSLPIFPEFSKLEALEELEVEAVWPRIELADGCLPPRLTRLHLGPSPGTGFLPPALASATQLRELRLLLPGTAQGAHLRRLTNLTRLELYQGQFFAAEFRALTALESLELWGPSRPVDGSHFEALSPLSRLTCLALHNAHFQHPRLPPELSALASLQELVIEPGPFVGPGALDAAGALTRLSKLVLPGARLRHLPSGLTHLTGLRELDLGL